MAPLTTTLAGEPRGAVFGRAPSQRCQIQRARMPSILHRSQPPASGAARDPECRLPHQRRNRLGPMAHVLPKRRPETRRVAGGERAGRPRRPHVVKAIAAAACAAQIPWRTLSSRRSNVALSRFLVLPHEVVLSRPVSVVLVAANATRRRRQGLYNGGNDGLRDHDVRQFQITGCFIRADADGPLPIFLTLSKKMRKRGCTTEQLIFCGLLD